MVTVDGFPVPVDVAGPDKGSVVVLLGAAQQAASAYDAVSLESYRFGDEGDGETYAESIGVEDERFELVEYGATIAPTLQALPPRDRIVLHLRFVEDLTQAEIAERVGVSQMHVSRLIRRALERLRTVAEHAG